MSKEYIEMNFHFIDTWVEDGWEWGQPISHEIFEKAKKNEWFVLLTPTKPVPKEWFGRFQKADILGLVPGEANKCLFFLH